MTREIHTLRDDSVAWYSSALADATEALFCSSYESALDVLAPIAGEVWTGSLTVHGKAGGGVSERSSRVVSAKVRAQVFLRDGFLCSYCGGRTIPRNVLVALSDVFPEALPYYRRYKRGTIHPAYWALAPEADHTLAYANGGSSEINNLTTMHAMCNTRKANLAVDVLPAVAAEASTEGSWDGLLSSYADIIIAGATQGRRHSSADYHLTWLRAYGLLDDCARVRTSAAGIC